MTCFIPDIPNEKSKQAFRQYLERSGVVDRITSALVMLFSLEERPDDPLDFIRRNLGDPRPEVAEYEAALKSLEDARLEAEQLKINVDQLKRRLAKFEGSGEEVDGSEEEKCGL
uniref:c-Myc-binding protein n=1 Tax=Cacopsylla melanoneura TaxID=428564 RepID=A0A8D9BRP7_9HEMI